MLFHRAGADDEGGRNGGVGAPFGHQRQYLSLPGRKRCNGVDFPGQELRHDLRVEGAPTLSDSLEGVHELGYFAVGGTRGVGRPLGK